MIIEAFFRDVRYGIRTLLKRPTFTTVAVITLALGIGANTAIFTIVNAVLLRPLPYPQSERVMMLGARTPSYELGAVTRNKFVFWRERSQSFDAMATYRTFSGATLNNRNVTTDVSGLRVSADFFRVLGTNLKSGRTFTAEEDQDGGPPAAILSDELANRLFGGEVAEGKTITINTNDYTVVGVMPADFWFRYDADVALPLQLGATQQALPGGSNYPVLGRLKTGVTREQALAEMGLVVGQFSSAYPDQMLKGEGVNVIDYHHFMVGDVRQLLFILFGAVAFVLLIACANVANLQLSRASSRAKEIAIRDAVGASRPQLLRQLLTEAAVLSVAGGSVGILLAYWGVSLFKNLLPAELIPRADQISFDPRVILFTLVVSMLTGILFGLAPAFNSTRLDVVNILKQTGAKESDGTGKHWFRSALVISQLALTVVLLIGATLLIRTFLNLRAVDPGFDASDLLTYQIIPRGPRYETTAQISQFNSQALDRIRALPGVEAVATTNQLPLQNWLNLPLEFAKTPGDVVSAEWRMISPDYFRVMKMGLKQGREFTDRDSDGAPGVVIVNERFAQRYFANQNVLGQQMFIGRPMSKELEKVNPVEVVGVVSDNKQRNLMEKAPPTIFVPTGQVPDALMKNFKGFTFIVRTSGEPLSYVAAVQREMLSLDNQQPIQNVRSMEQVIARSIAPQRFRMMLMGLFGVVGLLLAAIGIYGVMSYLVAQRTQEIGIRMALGAQTKDVLKLVLQRGLILTLVGTAMGVAGAWALTKTLKALLFGVTPTDVLTFVCVSIGLILVALLACYLPARRATKVDPLVALRYE